MPTPARRPKRSPRRLRKFYAMIVKVFTLARVAKLADARDLKSRVPKGTYRFNSGPGHQAPSLRSLDCAMESFAASAQGWVRAKPRKSGSTFLFTSDGAIMLLPNRS